MPPMGAPYLILDFDSTFVTVEALELLGEIALEADPAREAKLAEVKALTEQAMNGEIGFAQALARRIEILKPRREHVETLVGQLREKVTPSIERNRDFLERAGERLFIVTGGFHEYVDQIAAEFGVTPDRVLANRLLFDAAGAAVGVDATLPLSRDGGKVEAVRALGLEGEVVVVVGDGWTDYEIRAAGAADRFYAFVETASRPKVTAVADVVAGSFDEVLHREGLEGRWSYPRSRMRMLLLETLHPDAIARFRDEGYQVETVKGALSEDQLAERLKGVHVLGLRSKTQLTRRALEGADRLLAVGAFCIGTDQIDLAACTDKGVAVFNAPFSNTRSVVEMAIGEIVVLTRRLFDKSSAAHRGVWDKSASGAHEIRGRTLGIVGYGAIGAQLSVLAEALGMRVVYYDVAEKLALGNARRCRTLNELLEIADVVSLHVDGRPENKNLIGAAEIARMQDGAILLNLSRGHVVDVDALSGALRSGKLGGAGVDVFPKEPSGNDQPFESVLCGAPNLILTPHIGASTEEGQAAIGEFASERLLAYLHRGDTSFSVNLPNVQLSEVRGAHRLLHIHRNQPGVLAGINQVVAEHGLNILAQLLKTREDLGYVITDVDQGYDRGAVDALRAVPGTLKVRLVY
jgi:D-3-phosphoglycerate dehydrogenase / 2-oxoglutarate reductase